MTIDNLKSFLMKKERKCAILDENFTVIWDADCFFKSRKISFPPKESFTEKKEIIITIGSGRNKIPVSITEYELQSGEIRYACEAFDRETVSDLASKSEISDILEKYIENVNGKLHTILLCNSLYSSSDKIREDPDLLGACKNQAGASYDLLALSINLDNFLKDFSFTGNNKNTDIFKTVSMLVIKCNRLLKTPVIIFNSKDRGKDHKFVAKIPERGFTIAFLNLIQNALNYSKENGKIDVRISGGGDSATVSVMNEVGAGIYPDSGNIRLGIGIPVIERIVKSAGGKFAKEDGSSTYVSRITLPLYSEEEAVLMGHTEDYLIENDFVVNSFLNPFIEK